VLDNHRAGPGWITITLVLFINLGQTSLAQSSADQKKTLTLAEAVDFALKNYPAARAALERVTAAQAGVGLARTNYLPRADVVWQANRATDNNITGLVLPQSIIAPISGPVPIATSNQSAWGSAAGLLFSWEPFDFGYRGAKVGAARAARDQATAEASLTRLDVAIATVNACLTVLAAQRTMRAADADVQRRDTFDKAVRVVFVLSGLVAMLIKAPPRVLRTRSQSLALAPVGFIGFLAPAGAKPVMTVFFFFLKAGAFVFGSGLAIVPFLYGGVVNGFHWLTERQFLDAVAVAMITPGPVVITSGFIGYLVAGPLGAFAATLAVFLPPYLLVVFGAPYYRRFAKNRQVKAFVQGVTAAAVGAIAGAAIILSKRAVMDLPTVLIAVVSLLLLLRFERIPEPLIILGAGIVGLTVKHGWS
jgi:putative chromate ion transporter